MKIHCSKAFAEKLKKAGWTVDGFDPSTGNQGSTDLGDWHAHIFNMQRRQCILFCHNQTRFMLLFPIVTMKELKRLDYWFSDLLGNVLMKSDIDPELTEFTIEITADQIQIDTQTDRSVQGTINRVIQELKYQLEYDGTHIEDLAFYSTSVWLNDRPCKVKGMKVRDFLWPKRAMKDHLTELFQKRVLH